MGASYSAVPGPLAHGAAAVSVELGPPAAWVGGGREGAVITARLTPPPQLEEVSQCRLCPPFYPTPTPTPP